MSHEERMTEVELQEIESDDSPHMRKFGQVELRLAREVRRLRTLIFEEAAAIDSGNALFDEALAIRDEQAR